jgi:predicted nucleic acid-binding protein
VPGSVRKTHSQQQTRRKKMEHFKQLWQYYNIRLQASREIDRDRGEVSATTVVLAASLIALAISVGVIVSGKVRDKANDLNLG